MVAVKGAQSGAVGAGPDEIEAVPVDAEAVRPSRALQGIAEGLLEIGRELEVSYEPATRADQMMVVMIRQGLGELVSGVVVVGDDAGDRAHFLEDGEVAVHAGLGKRRVELEDLWDRDRPAVGLQGRDHPPASGRVPVAAAT